MGSGLAGEYRDEGESGAAPLERRKGLLEALGRLRGGGVLLVAKRDRLARDPIVQALPESFTSVRCVAVALPPRTLAELTPRL